MEITLIIIFLVSFLAFALSAICGGGAGLIIIPVLGTFLPVSQVPAALSIGTFTSSGSRLALFRKSVNWHIVKYFVPAAIPAVWLGALLLKYIDPFIIQIVMSVFLISNVTALFRRKNTDAGAESGGSNFVLVIIGFLAGFLSGLTGAVGLLFNKFYFRFGLTKEEIVATRAANEIILHLIKIVLYTLFGLISSKVIVVGIVVAVSGLLSTLSMKWVLPLLSESAFRKIGYMAMVLSGLVMFRESVTGLLDANHGRITMSQQYKGMETKLKWQHSHYTLEFTYDEGFEFEQVIPFRELTAPQQQFVLSNMENADSYIIESVHTFSGESFEVYYFYKGALIKKLDFTLN